MLQSLEGQAMELGWIRDNRCDITEKDYLTMVLKKTCWYSFIHPCRIGALIATQDSIDLDRFNRFGFFMGAAFQIQDDILNLVGDGDKYGKEIAGDLYEGKRTLMLAHLIKSSVDIERERLQKFLSLPRAARTMDEVKWTLGRMDHYRSIPYATAVSRHFANATLHEFETAFHDVPDSADKDFMPLLIRYMIERNL